MRLGFIALLSRALGDSLNPDCTARACRMPRLFMSILAKHLHPVVIASVDCFEYIRGNADHWRSCHEPERASREPERDWNRAGRACHESGGTLIEHLAILNEHEK